MSSPVYLLAILGLLLLNGGETGASFESAVTAEIEEAIEEFMRPLFAMKAEVEGELRSRRLDTELQLEEEKKSAAVRLQSLPADCASTYLNALDGIDLDSCENLTYTIEEIQHLVNDSYNLSTEIWKDVADTAKGVVKCPGLNPILVARCLIETLKDVRDKIREYRPRVLPLERRAQTEVANLKNELSLCLNYKRDHVRETVKTAVRTCSH